jgi:NAD(P)-dependent dehydrogenase (short-subunit alcohol dehydrogenase family)
MDPAGAVIVVTGAASGIGAALCRRFAAADAAAVVLADRDIKGAGRIAAEVGGLAIECDVSREDEVVRVIQATEDRFGPIDLFCANAGIAFAGDEQTPDGEWERMWRVNFMSHVYAARHLIPAWKARGGGYFLSTVSAAGLLTNLHALQYTVTKHAALALAEWLAITYGEAGIRVSCLCPQGVLTPMLEGVGALWDMLRPTALTTEQVAETVMEGLRVESFLILPHPEVARYVLNKAADRDRWIEGMRSLQARLAQQITGVTE